MIRAALIFMVGLAACKADAVDCDCTSAAARAAEAATAACQVVPVQAAVADATTEAQLGDVAVAGDTDDAGDVEGAGDVAELKPPELPVRPEDIGGGIETFSASMFARPMMSVTFPTDGAVLDVGSISWTAKEVKSDRHDGFYSSMAAEKGQTFVTFNLDLTTADKSNAVPQFYVVRFVDGVLKGKPMHLFYYRWDSHASKAGLSPDRGNDFRYADTVKFVAWTRFDEPVQDEPLFIVTLAYRCGAMFMHPTRDLDTFHATAGCPPFTPINGDKFFDWYKLVGARNMKKAFATK